MHKKNTFNLKELLFILIFLPVLSGTIYPQLPPVKLQYSSYALSADGRLIGYYGDKHRVEVKSTGYISKWVIYSLIATEDRDFYNHDGVSYKGLGRAILKTLSGSTQGGSTLTMQLARNLFLSREQTITRKLTEINIARELEKKYTKDQILLLYLNTCYFGHGAYGIWAAAEEFFSKTPDKLSVTESATLAGLLQSPSAYDPAKSPQKALNRRNEVLHNLLEVGKLSQREFERYRSRPLGLKMNQGVGRHFLEHVRKEALAILNSRGISLNSDQLKITTTLDYEIQKAAEDAVNWQYGRFPASMKQAQVGLVSVEVGTGKIKAMVGGSPSSESRGLNHTDEIHRQPGSSFKPFLYASLLEKGFTLATPLKDFPIVVDSGTVREWKPENSTGSFSYSMTPMIDAIKHSVNACAADAMVNLTCPDSVAAFASRLGIKSNIPPYPSIALGTAEVTPLEMAAAYGVFASEGLYAKPYSILKIEDKNSRVLYQAHTNTETVLDSATAYLTSRALEEVVSGGTANSVKPYFKGVAAGKTGTTQNSADVWFVGYNTRLSTAIWIGYDNPSRKLGGGFQYGGSACAPIWARMMSVAHLQYPGSYGNQFRRPSTVADIEVCEDSGEPATGSCPRRKLYPVNFLLLKGSCHIHQHQIGKKY
ncbi:MAG: PBP1A family penicillin-binding protein [Ignavibacteria bacterium]|jgi:1A family penicillin-binding protein|nr:PBP1A family penicillin-binding protein [Ignavibacteria bacterium]MCU7501857.1 PBP1A family penicillin-binding protein [Ignavibacteria bacterium]MCU7514797.1 PBP1A family penicillin-binding protein [Ignavibacteria bacterium]